MEQCRLSNEWSGDERPATRWVNNVQFSGMGNTHRCTIPYIGAVEEGVPESGLINGSTEIPGQNEPTIQRFDPR